LIVKSLAGKGIKVVVLDVNAPKASLGENVSFYQTDVSSSSSIKKAAEEIRAAHGDPSVLINNAGLGFGRTVLDESEEEIRKTIDVNLIAHFLTVKEFMPSMVSKNHGHVVTVASMASFVTIAQNVTYSTTKAAVLSLHEGLRQELDHRHNAPNVRTSVVHPTFVRTPMTANMQGQPGFPKKLLEPKEVADAIVAQVLLGQSGQIFLPRTLSLASGIKGYPTWLQDRFRGRLAKVITL